MLILLVMRWLRCLLPSLLGAAATLVTCLPFMREVGRIPHLVTFDAANRIDQDRPRDSDKFSGPHFYKNCPGDRYVKTSGECDQMV